MPTSSGTRATASFFWCSHTSYFDHRALCAGAWLLIDPR